jgi:hypothetical protein
MDAFENSDQDGKAALRTAKFRVSCLSATAIENPFFHHAGPTYHMVSNASVLLCHLMNGMHAKVDGPLRSHGIHHVLEVLTLH